MENYSWGNYPFTDEQKAWLLYSGQQLLNSGMLPRNNTFVSYQQPISNRVGSEYAERYPVMDDDTINKIIELTRNKYKPAIDARNEFRQLPRGYKDTLSRQFYMR